jgi:hypothetical protein
MEASRAQSVPGQFVAAGQFDTNLLWRNNIRKFFLEI